MDGSVQARLRSPNAARVRPTVEVKVVQDHHSIPLKQGGRPNSCGAGGPSLWEPKVPLATQLCGPGFLARQDPEWQLPLISSVFHLESKASRGHVGGRHSDLRPPPAYTIWPSLTKEYSRIVLMPRPSVLLGDQIHWWHGLLRSTTPDHPETNPEFYSRAPASTRTSIRNNRLFFETSTLCCASVGMYNKP